MNKLPNQELLHRMIDLYGESAYEYLFEIISEQFPMIANASIQTFVDENMEDFFEEI